MLFYEVTIMDNMLINKVEEKIIQPMNGIVILILSILMFILCIPVFIFGVYLCAEVNAALGVFTLLASVMMLVLALANYFCGVTMLIAYALMQDTINNIVRFNNQGNPYGQGGAYANSDNING